MTTPILTTTRGALRATITESVSGAYTVTTCTRLSSIRILLGITAIHGRQLTRNLLSNHVSDLIRGSLRVGLVCIIPVRSSQCVRHLAR